MFRLYANSLSDEEVTMLRKLWEGMTNKIAEKCTRHNWSCETCKYKRLCDGLDNTEAYIYKVCNDRDLLKTKTD